MSHLLHPLFSLLASITRQELARQVAYLKEENKILRSRLPERLVATPQEKQRLLRFGRKLGQQLKELISIVTYQSFLRWAREAEAAHTTTKATPKRNPGRPRTGDDIRELVLKLARENSWGYTRILGELRKLGIESISRQTVKVILKENGIDPTSKRGAGSWDEFLSRHAQTLWQCDFLSKPMWTAKGLVDLYFLVFIHLGTRRVWLSPCTPQPNSAWVCQQGRNFLQHAEDADLPVETVMRDNDAKYSAAFDDTLKSSGAIVKRNTPMSPNLRAHVERVIQTLKFEVPDKFVVVAERHLNYIIREAIAWYNHERPHSARDHAPTRVREVARSADNDQGERSRLHDPAGWTAQGVFTAGSVTEVITRRSRVRIRRPSLVLLCELGVILGFTERRILASPPGPVVSAIPARYCDHAFST